MGYLLLCILSSTGIFVIFKLLDRKRVPSYPVILINYLVASVFGFLINPVPESLSKIVALPWFPLSILIGFLFIVMFFVIARSSSEAGITITTVAGKMSVVFPIAFSILIEPDDHLTILKGVAIVATLTGVLLTIYEPGRISTARNRMVVPLLLFAGMGIVDSLVKFAQFKYVKGDDTALFSAVLFAMAFFTGLFILPFIKRGIIEFKRKESWLYGTLLGVVNFGSIFLMVSALNHVNSSGVTIDSSVIFGANNIGIVSLSVLSGLLIFNEKLRPINWTGIGISAVAILLFTLS